MSGIGSWREIVGTGTDSLNFITHVVLLPPNETREIMPLSMFVIMYEYRP